MELRDKLNSLEGYQEIIDKKEKFIQRDIKEYEENHETWLKDRINSHIARIYMYSNQILISKYSMGQPISSIMEEYKTKFLAPCHH
ncbi:MAG: DUF1910 domain-containing protein [Apibacter sp.]|nr:DUF1910 domain-containing protein [Apibacter sp.]